MVVLTAKGTGMAKKVGRPKKAGGEGSQVRIDRDLALMAKAIANHRGATVGEYLGTLLRADILRDYGKMMKEIEPRLAKPQEAR